MSNDAISRLFNLQAKINMMVVDGTRNPEEVANVLQKILEERRPHLHHLTSTTLAPTRDRVTIAESEDVFTGYLDPDFRNWHTDVPGEDTDEMMADVHEMRRNGTFRDLFGALGDPHSLCLTQGQIVEFCRNHHNKLRQDGYGTFFLFEVKSTLFVALVYVYGGKLGVYVDHFDNDIAWLADARHRLVVRATAA